MTAEELDELPRQLRMRRKEGYRWGKVTLEIPARDFLQSLLRQPDSWDISNYFEDYEGEGGELIESLIDSPPDNICDKYNIESLIFENGDYETDRLWIDGDFIIKDAIKTSDDEPELPDVFEQDDGQRFISTRSCCIFLKAMAKEFSIHTGYCSYSQFSDWSMHAALHLQHGYVVTWGRREAPDHADEDEKFIEPSDLDTQLSRCIIKIFSTDGAFAALKEDTSVVTWGMSGDGGDSSSVKAELLSGVVNISSTVDGGAFAALKNDGSIISWGCTSSGGDASSVIDHLKCGVVAVFSTSFEFAALKSDGSVITWGEACPSHGGVPSKYKSHLSKDVLAVYSDGHLSFAALKNDGSVISWGGVDFMHVPACEDDAVKDIVCCRGFAAIKADGSIMTWGTEEPNDVADRLGSNVVQVVCTRGAFAALKSDGSVVSWGSLDHGGDCAVVADQLRSGVVSVIPGSAAFVALKEDGSVVAWGDPIRGGNINSCAEFLRAGVREVIAIDDFKRDEYQNQEEPRYNAWRKLSSLGIESNLSAFAAIKEDGMAACWGELLYESLEDSRATFRIKAREDGSLYIGAKYASIALPCYSTVYCEGRDGSLYIKPLPDDLTDLSSIPESMRAVTGGVGSELVISKPILTAAGIDWGGEFAIRYGNLYIKLSPVSPNDDGYNLSLGILIPFDEDINRWD